MYGFYRIAAAVPQLKLTNPISNVESIVSLMCKASDDSVSFMVFPELTLTGYTAADLFFQEKLYEAQNEAFETLLKKTSDISTVAAVGIALRDSDRLYNCAAVIQNGKVLGVVPKSYIPNKREFYEKRHFTSGRDITRSESMVAGEKVPFGVDLLFDDGAGMTAGVELCEDLWAVTPPSSHMASNGANVIFNLSASNELIGKARYREELIRSQSARAVCAYAYASCGAGESTTDMVFGGDTLIAEYGTLLGRGERFRLDEQLLTADVDLQKLRALRLAEGAYSDSRKKRVRTVTLSETPRPKEIRRQIDPHPFVPKDSIEKSERSKEIISIQAHGLARRMLHAGCEKAVIGVSGGLDSTLALLVTNEAFLLMEKDPGDILAVTMPGFGTTGRTLNNALALCEKMGIMCKKNDIERLALEEFRSIEHDPSKHDTTYENVQARIRTTILMNMANKHNGLVVGTGDLSEIALGWSTYNGDHMSMYAVNSSVPKTLIRYLIEYYMRTHPDLGEILADILDTPVSPELLPADSGTITQKTENIIGPYELHDFFLYHFIRYGASPEKILWLASNAFGDKYDKMTISKWLKLFLKRFFSQQFKRSCMPDGPKVGTVSLSPRADWRMPSDADVDIWLKNLP